MSWLIAAYSAVLLGIFFFVMRIRRLRRGLTPPVDRRPPRR